MQIQLNPTCIAATIAPKLSATEPGEQVFSPTTGPALRRHVSHAPVQLRLATHAQLAIEIKINFPVPGGRTSRTNSPKPPLCICI